MGSKLPRILAVVLGVALAAGSFAAETPWTVPEMLPPDTLAVLTVRDVPTIASKAKETGLYKILTSPDVDRVFRKQFGQARGAIFAGEVMLGEKAADLLSFFSQGEITFAVLGMDKRLPNGQPLADLLLSLQLKDKAPAFVEEFNKRLDQLKAATNGALQSTTAQLGNSTITRLKFDPLPSEISCGLCDGTFLICMGEGRIEKLMAMHEKMKTAQAPAAGAAPDVLAQTADYKKALEKAGPDADLVLFVNVDAAKKNPIINDPNIQQNPTQQHELAMSGLLAVKAASYALGIKGTGVRETVFLDVPAANRKGALGLFDGEGADLNQFYAAPKNSLLAWTFKVNPEQLLEKVVAMAEMERPQAREEVAAGLLFIGQQLNLDPKRDLLGALTGQGVFSLSVPQTNDKLPLAFPQPILSLRIKDPEAVKRVTASLTAAAQEKLEFKELAENGKTIVIARDKDTPPNEMRQFCYVVDGDDIVLSTYPLALRAELKRRSTKAARLDEDPDFIKAKAAMSGQPQAMLYLDTAALAVAAYDVLIPVAQMMARDQQIDLNALPMTDLLNENLGGTLVNLNFAPDGILMQGYSPAGVLSLLIPASIIAPMAAARRAAQNDFNGPAAPPAMAVQPRGKADTKKVEALEKLARDLKDYAQEHGGNFPKTLDEMKPKYLQDLGKDLEQIVYLGKQAADNRIVAHSSEKLPGSIAVLLQNGTVQNIIRSYFPKVLREGFVEPAKDPNAPVKPPKPPEF